MSALNPQGDFEPLGTQLPTCRAPRVVFGVIGAPTGRIALGHRSRYCGASGNKWSFFGGSVDPGENAFEALTRELREEAGLRIRDWKALHSFPTEKRELLTEKSRGIWERTGQIVDYQCQIMGAILDRERQPRLNWEHDRSTWADPKQLIFLDDPLHPGARRALQNSIIQRFISSFQPSRTRGVGLGLGSGWATG